MDRDTRNLLANTTQALRRGLEEEFALQLEGRFDVLRDGSIADAPGPQLDDSEKLTRRKIVEAIHHRRASGESEQESVDGFLRETAFTFLNRLAALKMMEARGIVQECVSACDSHGFNARGFKEFGGLAPGLIDLADGGYRLYLECIFDEIGREVGILFDPTDPASLLWPRRTALLDALGRINDPKLAGIWSEDETIGWIYQYYNDPEERRKMRDVKQGGSAAPRNSREMAVRNQFFTPRYVVEFLTDIDFATARVVMLKTNDHGDGMFHSGPYLAPPDRSYRPGTTWEIPLADFDYQQALTEKRFTPEQGANFIRETKGCWDHDRADPLTREEAHAEFIRRIPALILEHNIHGIDIDPRAAQIAGLALGFAPRRHGSSRDFVPRNAPPSPARTSSAPSPCPARRFYSCVSSSAPSRPPSVPSSPGSSERSSKPCALPVRRTPYSRSRTMSAPSSPMPAPSGKRSASAMATSSLRRNSSTSTAAPSPRSGA